MRHRTAGKKLGRSPAHRRALLRNLVTELLERESVKTTDAKAKELKRWGDRLITLGKAGTLHARRRAAGLVQRASVVRKLFAELGPRYAARTGGYTRVVKLGTRAGDAASISLVELVDRRGAGADAAGKKKKAPRRKAAAQGGDKQQTPRRRAAAG